MMYSVEVGCDAEVLFLLGHIPGTCYIETHQLEHAPLWNQVPDQALQKVLLDNGIRHDTTVLLYGRNDLAPVRAAHLMLYAGIEDVRLLNGGFEAWKTAVYVVVAGPAVWYPSVSDFGARFPGRPEYLIDMHQVKQLLQHKNGMLISIRTWLGLRAAVASFPRAIFHAPAVTAMSTA